MPRSRWAEDLTKEELRQLLIDKQRAERQLRLDHDRRTGRAIVVEPEPFQANLELLRSEALPLDEDDPDEGTGAVPPAPAPIVRRRTRRSWWDRLLLLVELGRGFGPGVCHLQRLRPAQHLKIVKLPR